MPSIPSRSDSPASLPPPRPSPEPAALDPALDGPALADEHNAWRHSSIELERGLDILELPIDSLPGELQDDLLPSAPTRG